MNSYQNFIFNLNVNFITIKNSSYVMAYDALRRETSTPLRGIEDCIFTKLNETMALGLGLPIVILKVYI